MFVHLEIFQLRELLIMKSLCRSQDTCIFGRTDLLPFFLGCRVHLEQRLEVFRDYAINSRMITILRKDVEILFNFLHLCYYITLIISLLRNKLMADRQQQQNQADPAFFVGKRVVITGASSGLGESLAYW